MELLNHFIYGIEDNVKMLMILALVSGLQYCLAGNNHKSDYVLAEKNHKDNFELAMIKRDDDLFQIRYDWFNTVVVFSGEILDLADRYDYFVQMGNGDPSEEEKFSHEQLHVHNKIQRHMTKGALIFSNENFHILFKDFGESTQILHSEKRYRMKEWSKFLLDLFETKKLFLSLGPEINLKK